MNNLELIAIMPATDAQPPNSRLRFVTSGEFTGVFGPKPRKVNMLPQSRKAALANAAARQVLLEACMPLGPLLVVRSQCDLPLAEFNTLIAANRPLLDQQVRRVSGLVQYQVTVSWTPAGVLGHFRNAPELASLFEVGQITQDALTISITALATRLGYQMVQTLEAVSHDLLHLPPGPDILLNAVLLVRPEDTAELDQAVEAIDAIWPDGLNIRQIGPAPAASFALLDPVRITAAEVAAATQRLGLPLLSDRAEVGQARHQALIARPNEAAQIKQDANIATAAARFGQPDAPFWFCTVRSDDQAQTSFSRKAA